MTLFVARPDLPLALVVGCGGLGMACARRLGHDHRLMLIDIDAALARTAAESLGQEGYDASWARCDITDQLSIEALSAVLGGLGGVTTLAHVAGLAPSCGDALAIMRVNAVGPALMAQTCLPLMRPGGAAVMFSSLGGHIVPADPALIAVLDEPLAPDFLERLAAQTGAGLTPSNAYGWSKIALMRLCRRLVVDWAKAGVRINSISPGAVTSPMGDRETLAEPRKRDLVSRIPMGRVASMIEIAEVAAFLCSQQASYISGTDVLVDGGLAAVLSLTQAAAEPSTIIGQ